MGQYAVGNSIVDAQSKHLKGQKMQNDNSHMSLNKLASLEATLVRNYDWPTQLDMAELL